MKLHGVVNRFMRIVVLIVMILIGLLPADIRSAVTLALSMLWAIYTLYIFIKLIKYKDKKIKIDECSSIIPSNSNASHIRYLYSKKVDNKVFISSIFELLLKGSISLKRVDMKDYYFVDNHVVDEVLNKNEMTVKKILFREIGNTENVSLSKMKYAFTKNSGYMYSIYKSWKDTFTYECVNDKYFKSIKPIVDNTMFYFVISMIIAIYNILFTHSIIIFLVIFSITSILVKFVNDMKNLEDDAKEEYIKWLKFRNYLNQGNILDVDVDKEDIERCAIYSYVLEVYPSFKEKLNTINPNIINDSVLLSIMNADVFDYIVNEIDKYINTCKYKSILFSKNKGRRV